MTIFVQARVIQIACDVKDILTTALHVSPGIGGGCVCLSAGQVV